MDAKKLLEKYAIREIWIHLDDLLKEGYDINDLIELGPPYECYFVEDAERLLKNGADASNLFFKARAKYKQLTCFPEIIGEDFRMYVKYGLDKKVAKSWIEANINKEDLVSFNEYFKFFEIDPADYIPEYFDCHEITQNWDRIAFGLENPIIKPETFVLHYGIPNISDTYRYSISKKRSGFSVFIEEYAELGGDLDFLSEKVLEAYGGYPEDEDKLVNLTALLELGSSKIDANCIIDSLTCKAYNYKDAKSVNIVNKYFHNALKEHADKAHLEKIKPTD